MSKIYESSSGQKQCWAYLSSYNAPLLCCAWWLVSRWRGWQWTYSVPTGLSLCEDADWRADWGASPIWFGHHRKRHNNDTSKTHFSHAIKAHFTPKMIISPSIQETNGHSDFVGAALELQQLIQYNNISVLNIRDYCSTIQGIYNTTLC